MLRSLVDIRHCSKKVTDKLGLRSHDLIIVIFTAFDRNAADLARYASRKEGGTRPLLPVRHIIAGSRGYLIRRSAGMTGELWRRNTSASNHKTYCTICTKKVTRRPGCFCKVARRKIRRAIAVMSDLIFWF